MITYHRNRSLNLLQKSKYTRNFIQTKAPKEKLHQSCSNFNNFFSKFQNIKKSEQIVFRSDLGHFRILCYNYLNFLANLFKVLHAAIGFYFGPVSPSYSWGRPKLNSPFLWSAKGHHGEKEKFWRLLRYLCPRENFDVKPLTFYTTSCFKRVRFLPEFFSWFPLRWFYWQHFTGYSSLRVACNSFVYSFDKSSVGLWSLL